MWYRTIGLQDRTISLQDQTVSIRLANVKEQLTSILRGDPNKIALVKQIVPQSKYQPAAAYFLARGADAEQIKSCFSALQELDARKKVSAIQVGKTGVSLNGQVYDDWRRFSEAVHGLTMANDDFRPSSTGPDTDIKPIAAGNNITITRGKNPSEASQLGMGTTWCVSDLKQAMFSSYRNTDSATFYFVEDGNQPENSPLRRVIINVMDTGIQITDLDNTTGTIAQFGDDANRYLTYLHQQGVDTSVLKNDPLTPEETTLNKKLEAVADSPDRYREFVNLPSALKSEFISRAIPLTTEELTFLASSKLDGLMNQYLNVGHAMSDGDFAVIAKNPAWVETFKRKRTQYIEHNFKLMTTSDANILPELFEQARPDLEKSLAEYHKITEAGDYDEYNMAYEELPAYYRDDKTFALKEYRDGKASFLNLPEELHDDKAFALKEYRDGKIIYRWLPYAMRNDPKFALEEYRDGKIKFGDLPPALQNDKAFALEAYREGKVDYRWLPYALKNDRAFALREYREGKVDYRDMPQEMQNEKAFALEAYRAGDITFSWLPDVLQNDRAFALAEYQAGKIMYAWLPKELRNDRDFALEAYRAGKVDYRWLPYALKNDRAFALAEYRAGNVSFESLPEEIRNDPTFNQEVESEEAETQNEVVKPEAVEAEAVEAR